MSRDSESRAPRAPGKARARVSLKMQAIGFLSRREHSRQELRAKLLDSLRKRAREEAALAAAVAQAAQELADALREQPSNGIDDAFAAPLAARVAASPVSSAPTPRAPAPAARDARENDAGRGLRNMHAAQVPAQASGAEPESAASAVVASAGAQTEPAHGSEPRSRMALETLRLADGAALPSRLLATLASHAEVRSVSASAPAVDPEPADPDAATELERTDPEAAVDRLLDWLVANKYLSETRFVESRVNARSRKQGALLIKLELSRHGLALEPEQAAALRETEFARAQALWQRKFGEVAPDARLRAKQARFLAARGFAADVVRRVVGGEEEF
jgi:regulatory protein